MSAQRPSAGFLPGIIFGTLFVVVFWFGADLYPLVAGWFQPHEIHDAPPAAVPAMPEPVRTPRKETAIPPAPIVETPRRAPADRAADAEETLASLARTCAFWSARATDASGRMFRDKACGDMRAFAASTGQASPGIDGRAVEPETRTTRRKPKPVPVNECLREEKGSIAYRRCRVQENHRLKDMCHFHRARGEWENAKRWCAAYRAYPIVVN